MISPIGFSIPKELIVEKVPEKKKILATVIPGRPETYVFSNQEDYYKDYQESEYAITHKKGGWDCFRHYEILANGCIPIFPNLDKCPPRTMIHFPRDLTKSPEELLEFTRTHLTTESMATYVLDTIHQKPSQVLFLSFSIYCGVDYLRCLTLHGFKSLFGSSCHDFPRVDHLYKDYTGDCNQLWGRGFGCSKLLDASMRDSARDTTIEEDIRNHRYDLIVYGSVHRGMPLWEQVRAHYPPSQVVFFCGEDLHSNCPLDEIATFGHPCFKREIEC
jgi:hypothetical protein